MTMNTEDYYSTSFTQRTPISDPPYTATTAVSSYDSHGSPSIMVFRYQE